MSEQERFSDDDVRRIIAKATRVDDTSQGVNYDQLKEIASSVGVSEQSIQRVLNEEAPKRFRLRRIIPETVRTRIGRKLESWIDIVFHRSRHSESPGT